MNKFSKQKRLTSAANFQHVFRSQLKLVLPDLYLVAVKNTLNRARVGLAISKKNIPTAVGRNQVKRIIRESFRQLNDFASVDVVVVARKNLSNLPKQQLRSRLDYAWKKLSELVAA